mmetsp:Transcript_15850/g.43382  ORF Transcript_15850/g.43382 Transcript_15850/m.43382 type:complete len:349 (+) Transcript_15850:355-1401(+)
MVLYVFLFLLHEGLLKRVLASKRIVDAVVRLVVAGLAIWVVLRCLYGSSLLAFGLPLRRARLPCPLPGLPGVVVLCMLLLQTVLLFDGPRELVLQANDPLLLVRLVHRIRFSDRRQLLVPAPQLIQHGLELPRPSAALLATTNLFCEEFGSSALMFVDFRLELAPQGHLPRGRVFRGLDLRHLCASQNMLVNPQPVRDDHVFSKIGLARREGVGLRLHVLAQGGLLHAEVVTLLLQLRADLPRLLQLEGGPGLLPLQRVDRLRALRASPLHRRHIVLRRLHIIRRVQSLSAVSPRLGLRVRHLELTRRPVSRPATLVTSTLGRDIAARTFRPRGATPIDSPDIKTCAS